MAFGARLSVIICSRNRADALANCLKSLSLDEMRASSAELILVDNGSTDNTPAVVRSFKETAPFPVVLVSEPEGGLSRARNAGLAAASANVIVFTDDDCYFGAGYLRLAAELFQRPSFDYCGGRIMLYDPTDSPYGCNLTRTKFEPIPPRSFLRAGQIQGASLIITRKVVDAIGGFDPMLGAGTRFRCEDIDYCARASLAGLAGAYVPELIVYHHHGRKPGKDIERLDSANDVARGAYYAKYIMRGQWGYLRNWLTFMRWNPVATTWRELRGALSYTCVALLAGRCTSNAAAR
ncbi:MAG: glycosyltransferase family 2 protein [Terriglobales bacterium]